MIVSASDGEPDSAVISKSGRNGGDAGDRTPLRAPHFNIGGPVGSSWREQTLARIAEQRALAGGAGSRSALDADEAGDYARAIEEHLEAAKQAALSRPTMKLAISGAAV